MPQLRRGLGCPLPCHRSSLCHYLPSNMPHGPRVAASWVLARDRWVKNTPNRDPGAVIGIGVHRYHPAPIPIWVCRPTSIACLRCGNRMGWDFRYPIGRVHQRLRPCHPTRHAGPRRAAQSRRRDPARRPRERVATPCRRQGAHCYQRAYPGFRRKSHTASRPDLLGPPRGHAGASLSDFLRAPHPIPCHRHA